MVHQSFVDFLVEENRVDLPATHDRIANFYLSAWGGLDALFQSAGREELDGYGLRHMAEHLEKAGRPDDLHRLLRLERLSGGVENRTVRAENTWYAVQERVGQTEEYMNDLARAARLVQVADRLDVESSHYKTCIGLGFRYALMFTSLNSLARILPPTLIVALVEKGVWLPSQGLAYVRALRPEERVRALIGMSSLFDNRERGTLLREALDVARGISDERDRAQALSELAPCLTELGRMKEALEVALEIEDERPRARALAAPVLHLAELGRVEEALKEAREVVDQRDRVRRVAALGHVEEALKVALRVQDHRERDQALAELVLHLARLGRAEEALELARRIGEYRDRARAMAVLGRMELALEVVQGISDESDRAWALAELLHGLPELGHMDEALKVARGIGEQPHRNRLPGELSPCVLESGRVKETLQMARGTQNQRDRARTLAELGRVEEALEVVRGIGDPWDRSQALGELVPHLAELPRAKALFLWGETLGLHAIRSRIDLLADLDILAPVIAALGGSEAVEETCHAIEDVGRWWP